MRAFPLVVCAVFAWGCSGHDPEGDTDAGTSGGPVTGALGGYRCVVREPVALERNGNAAMTGLPWITRAPGGFRLYARVGSGTELRWRGGAEAGDVPAAMALREGAFGWTGDRFVAVLSERVGPPDFALDSVAPDWRGHRVVTLDAGHEVVATVRTALPESACSPGVTEMAGRVMLTWHRRSRGVCDTGEPWFQLLGREGEALGAAHALTESGLDVRVRSLTARWDFGRAVLVAQRSDTGLDLAWVIDGSGEVLWSGIADRVACARSGCVKVRVEHEVSTGDGIGGNSLKFERLLGGGAFGVTAAVPDVRGLVVSGDRVLVLHTPQNVTGCDLTVVDLATRAVVAEHHAESISCDERRVRATPRGFVLAGADSANGGVSRVIDCAQ